MARDDQQVNQAFKLYREIVERAWSDPAFLAELRKDTKGTLEKEFAARGLDISLYDQVKLIEDTDKVCHLAIPKIPPPGFC
jgi:hypothetical protein